MAAAVVTTPGVGVLVAIAVTDHEEEAAREPLAAIVERAKPLSRFDALRSQAAAPIYRQPFDARALESERRAVQC